VSVLATQLDPLIKPQLSEVVAGKLSSLEIKVDADCTLARIAGRCPKSWPNKPYERITCKRPDPKDTRRLGQ
jgi:hypothetical protein